MDRLDSVPSFFRGATPLAVLGALFAATSLYTIDDGFEIKPLDIAELGSTLVVFALVAAVTERAVEVLMLMRFGPGDGTAAEEMRALLAVENTQLAREKQQMEAAGLLEDPKMILAKLAEIPSASELLEKTAALEEARKSEMRTRSFWAGVCSLILSMAFALIGYRFVEQLVSVSGADDVTHGRVFLSLDVVITTLLISGGAEWFHKVAEALTPQSKIT